MTRPTTPRRAMCAAGLLCAALFAAATAVSCGGGGGATPSPTPAATPALRTVRTGTRVRVAFPDASTHPYGQTTPAEADPYLPGNAFYPRLILRYEGDTTGPPVMDTWQNTRSRTLEGEFRPGRYRLTALAYAALTHSGDGVPVSFGEQILEIGAAPDAPPDVPLPPVRSTVRRIAFREVWQPQNFLRELGPGVAYGMSPNPGLKDVSQYEYARYLSAVAYDAAGRVVPTSPADWRWTSSDPAAVTALGNLVQTPILFAPRGPVSADITARHVGSGARGTIRVNVSDPAAPTPTPPPFPTPEAPPTPPSTP